VFDPTVEIASKQGIKHKKNPSSSYSQLWSSFERGRRAEHTHNLREERKKKEKEVCPDLVAVNRSDSSQ